MKKVLAAIAILVLVLMQVAIFSGWQEMANWFSVIIYSSPGLFWYIIFILATIAYLMATYYLYQAAKEKADYRHGNGTLLFMALFLTPLFFELYIIVMTLPDKHKIESAVSGSAMRDAELPPI
jgi:hypothetical protein